MTGSADQTWLGGFLSALLAFLAPGAAVLGTAAGVSSIAGEGITQGEWVTALVAAIVASAAGEARAARRVRVETERGRQVAREVRDAETPPEAGSSVV